MFIHYVRRWREGGSSGNVTLAGKGARGLLAKYGSRPGKLGPRGQFAGDFSTFPLFTVGRGGSSRARKLNRKGLRVVNGGSKKTNLPEIKCKQSLYY